MMVTLGQGSVHDLSKMWRNRDLQPYSYKRETKLNWLPISTIAKADIPDIRGALELDADWGWCLSAEMITACLKDYLS